MTKPTTCACHSPDPHECALPLGLYVTHGIFSKGFDGLGAAFDRIYTTNTFGNAVAHEDAHTFECEAVVVVW